MEFPDVGDVHPGGDVPGDEADFVAVLVFAEVVEVEALALEGGVVFPGEGFTHEAAGPDLEPVHALHDFFDGVFFRHGDGKVLTC